MRDVKFQPLLCLAVAVVVAAAATSAKAQIPPPFVGQGMTFSVDFQGPTAGFVPGPFTGIPDFFAGTPRQRDRLPGRRNT